jgi:hypothetical protein
LACILLRFARLLKGDSGSPRVRETMQATFVMESRENGSAGLIWGSDGGGFQDVAWEQLVRETAHRVSKVLSLRPGLAANQSIWSLYNKIRSKLGRGLEVGETPCKRVLLE